ncbi:MAG TPA: hypothetical protein VI258_15045 [Rhodanobacteraceae bacterium]
MKTIDHAVAGERVRQRDERHPLMMCEVDGDDHAAFLIAAARRIVDRIEKAVFPFET